MSKTSLFSASDTVQELCQNVISEFGSKAETISDFLSCLNSCMDVAGFYGGSKGRDASNFIFGEAQSLYLLPSDYDELSNNIEIFHNFSNVHRIDEWDQSVYSQLVHALSSFDFQPVLVYTSQCGLPITTVSGYTASLAGAYSSGWGNVNISFSLAGNYGLFVYGYQSYQNRTTPIPIFGYGRVTFSTMDGYSKSCMALMITHYLPNVTKIYETLDAYFYDYNHNNIDLISIADVQKNLVESFNADQIIKYYAIGIRDHLDVSSLNTTVLATLTHVTQANAALLSDISARYPEGASGLISLLQDLYSEVKSVTWDSYTFSFTNNKKLITYGFSWSAVKGIATGIGQVVGLMLLSCTKIVGAVVYGISTIASLIGKALESQTTMNIHDNATTMALPYGLVQDTTVVPASTITLSDDNSVTLTTTESGLFSFIDVALVDNVLQNSVNIFANSESHVKLCKPSAAWWNYLDPPGNVLNLEAIRNDVALHGKNPAYLATPFEGPYTEYDVVFAYLCSLMNFIIFDVLYNTDLQVVNLASLFEDGEGHQFFDIYLLLWFGEHYATTFNDIMSGEVMHQMPSGRQVDVWEYLNYSEHNETIFNEGTTALWHDGHTYSNVLTFEKLSEGLTHIPSSTNYTISKILSALCVYNSTNYLYGTTTMWDVYHTYIYPYFYQKLSNGGATSIPPRIYLLDPPNMSRRGLLLSSLLTIGVIAAAAAITVTAVATFKAVGRASAARHASQCEAAWEAYKQSGSKADYKAYVKAVKKNNFASIFNGGTKYSKTGFWASCDSTGSATENVSSVTQIIGQEFASDEIDENTDLSATILTKIVGDLN